MTRFVIDPDVALHLARHDVVVAAQHQLVAPTLLRSQLLTLLYQKVRRNEMAKAEAERHLDVVRAMRIRLLGDRVLQSAAWRVADRLGWDDTYDAEYVALTQLQADALITRDPELADAARDLVTVAPVAALT
jgi:predicted nucleic acid-binding protein